MSYDCDLTCGDGTEDKKSSLAWMSSDPFSPFLVTIFSLAEPESRSRISTVDLYLNVCVIDSPQLPLCAQ